MGGISGPRILENSNGLLSVNFDDVNFEHMNTNDGAADQSYDQIMDMLDEMGTEKDNTRYNITEKQNPGVQTRSHEIPTKGLKILQASQINALEDKLVAESSFNNETNANVQESSEDSISQLKITNVESAVDSSKGDSALSFPSPDDPLPLSPIKESQAEDQEINALKETVPTPKKKSPV